MPAAMLASVGLLVLSGRGEPTSAPRPARCAASGSTRAPSRSTPSLPSSSTPRGRRPAGRRRRLSGRRRRARPDLARVVQRPDPPGGHHGRRRRGRASGSAPPSAADLAEADRLHGEGHTVLEQYADPSGFWGPEGRAWWSAWTPRPCACAGSPAPTHRRRTRWSRRGGRPSTLFADFGHVHEPAAVRAALAGILRATGAPPLPATVGDLARAVARALGAQPLLDQLRRSASPPRAASPPPDALTPREARDPRAGRPGPQQRRDRQAAVHQRQDGLGPRLQHPRQARRRRPHRGGRDRPRRGLLD